MTADAVVLVTVYCYHYVDIYSNIQIGALRSSARLRRWLGGKLRWRVVVDQGRVVRLVLRLPGSWRLGVPMGVAGGCGQGRLGVIRKR